MHSFKIYKVALTFAAGLTSIAVDDSICRSNSLPKTMRGIGKVLNRTKGWFGAEA